MGNEFRPPDWRERLGTVEGLGRRLSSRLLRRLGLSLRDRDVFGPLLEFVAGLPSNVRDRLGVLRRLELHTLDDGLDWLVATYERGRVRRRTNPVGLTFLQYNAALVSDNYRPQLLPPGWKYQQNYLGASRADAVARWITLLRVVNADVIGLNEVYGFSAVPEFPYVVNEQERLASAVNRRYPHSHVIPLQFMDPRLLSSAGRRTLFGEDIGGVERIFLDTVGAGELPSLPGTDYTFVHLPRPSELLLLASQVFDAHHLIYPTAFGADELAAKGVIQARFTAPSFSEYDVFLTHLQDPSASGDRTNAIAALAAQVETLRDFIASARRQHVVGPTSSHPPSAPRFLEVRPALLMGDLNIDGDDPTEPVGLSSLGHDRDLWRTTARSAGLSDNPTTPTDESRLSRISDDLTTPAVDESVILTMGVTSDTVNAFHRDSPPVPIISPSRHRIGRRIDQFLVFDGVYPVDYLTRARVVIPHFGNTRMVLWELTDASGVDLSDHYGVATTLSSEHIYWVEPFAAGAGDELAPGREPGRGPP